MAKKISFFKITLSTLIIFTLIVSMQAHAIIPFIFNPFAWYQEVKNTYKMRKNRTSSSIIQWYLNQLYQAENEVENLYKIYNAIQPIRNEYSWETTQSALARTQDIQTLKQLFKENQNKWYPFMGGHNLPLKGIDAYRERLKQKVVSLEKERGMTATCDSVSWHEKLTTAVAKLPRKEFYKTPEEREKEFRAWQQKDPRSFRNKFPK